MLPPSINQVYKIAYKARHTYKSDVAKKFEYQCKLFVPVNNEFKEQEKLRTYIELHGSWYFKNGNMRRKDLQNMDKVLVDAIFDKLGIDDSQIWDHHLIKVESEDEKTVVQIERILNEENEADETGEIGA